MTKTLPPLSVPVEDPAMVLQEHLPEWDWGGKRSNQLWGIPIVVSDSVPEGEIHIRDNDGNIAGKIINIGAP